MHLNSKQCWQAYQRKGNKKKLINLIFILHALLCPFSLLSLITEWRGCGEEKGRKQARPCPWQRARRVGERRRAGKLLQGVREDDSERLAYGEVLERKKRGKQKSKEKMLQA